jgi:hypothetical protein
VIPLKLTRKWLKSLPLVSGKLVWILIINIYNVGNYVKGCIFVLDAYNLCETLNHGFNSSV